MDTPTSAAALTPTLRTFSPSPSSSPLTSPISVTSGPLGPERSVSFASTTSASSRCSSTSRSDGVAPRRRGYARPQATSFADSARNRESVMNLGTIAHLQYYFARTGLLDGKGGQLYKPKEERRHSETAAVPRLSSSVRGGLKPRPESDSAYSSMRSSPDIALAHDLETSLDGALMDSAIQEDDENYGSDSDEMMLPPTVSTYNYRAKPVPRPPTMEEMRTDLRESLREASKVLGDAEKEEAQRRAVAPATPSPDSAPSALDRLEGATAPASSDAQGWHELQGMHILDLMTLAIRAAKIYYTAHDQPGRLSAIRSERKIREELLTVMETLKRMATRTFAGGMRREEGETMQGWISGVEQLLQREEEQERQERQERESWAWMLDEWTGRRHEQERAFLGSFDPCAEELPAWASPEDAPDLPTPFLEAMRSGVRLISLHNEMVAKSKRPFGHITAFHTDTMKPYRIAHNLRYWIKAAELRWEVVLHVDVMAVVHGRDPETWRAFDRELLRWCGKVREEFVGEWREKLTSGASLAALATGAAKGSDDGGRAAPRRDGPVVTALS
ncbi:MAG: hypothetical protein M1832_002367 [Thelocarpon impressellum]|nr:MAG: hypothetical protein M1832_002367 [Thelocarpon impressellum]